MLHHTQYDYEWKNKGAKCIDNKAKRQQCRFLRREKGAQEEVIAEGAEVIWEDKGQLQEKSQHSPIR